MHLPRNITIKINAILDQWLPPVLRDAGWLLPNVFKVLFDKQSHHFVEFKQKGMGYSREQFVQAYHEVDPLLYGYVQRRTDLNEAMIPEILRHITGSRVLEVGCGKGFLAAEMAKQSNVTACDMQKPSDWEAVHPTIPFVQGWIESLPFADTSFDTVVCTHTLEHVQDLFKAIQELRRVTKQRLIIIVPKQRPYKYTFDLHLHFFPYPYSLLAVMGPRPQQVCQELQGDLFYFETKS
ncbi:methyltransferase domain-containing protein [Patescibacteria group bacterium]|nr:methyltransferase domain-containing protein [Patescibacteria group bacterium]MBP9709697.1 methyltransferase domain-containing protein [Patescibacteria group bacterium]